MGVLIKTSKSEDILVMTESMVSEDWSFRRVDLVMAMLDKKFCPKDTMSKPDQRQSLGELTLKDGKDLHDFSLKTTSLELQFNNM